MYGHGKSKYGTSALLSTIVSCVCALVSSGEDFSRDSDTPFSRIVHLFAELVEQGLFSFEKYLYTLVARGDLLSMPLESSQVSPATGQSILRQNLPTTGMLLNFVGHWIALIASLGF